MLGKAPKLETDGNPMLWPIHLITKGVKGLASKILGWGKDKAEEYGGKAVDKVVDTTKSAVSGVVDLALKTPVLPIYTPR
ncbi:hypothetical protein ACFL21_04285 [Patescibacteria group bacterium]